MQRMEMEALKIAISIPFDISYTHIILIYLKTSVNLLWPIYSLVGKEPWLWTKIQLAL